LVEVVGHRPWAPSVMLIDPATHEVDAAGDPDAGRTAVAY
jgi:hypothetical protein